MIHHTCWRENGGCNAHLFLRHNLTISTLWGGRLCETFLGRFRDAQLGDGMTVANQLTCKCGLIFDECSTKLSIKLLGHLFQWIISLGHAGITRYVGDFNLTFILSTDALSKSGNSIAKSNNVKIKCMNYLSIFVSSQKARALRSVTYME